MRFLVDENVRGEILQFLLKSGHDAIAPLPGTSDANIAGQALREERIILTHDAHFADILMYPPKKYPGIIRIRIHPPSAEDLINALTALFGALAPSGFKGKLIVLEKNGFRLR